MTEELTPAEIAVLDAIIAQRIDSEGDVFGLNCSKIREHLNKTGASKKLFITPSVQRGIIFDLSQAHIIDMDCIVDSGFIHNYRASQNPKYAPDKSMPKYFWSNNTDWAREVCQLNGFISIERAYSLDNGAIYIKMTEKDMENLMYKYTASRIVQLKIDKDRNCLSIKIEDGNWLHSPALHEDRIPFKILSYAHEKPGQRISRQLLEREGINVGKKYLKTQVFGNNRTVEILSLTPLLDLDRDYIIFRRKAMLTVGQVKKLREVFSI